MKAQNSNRWFELFVEAQDASSRLLQGGLYRSSTSRAYYAAYSLVTSSLIEVGYQPPKALDGPAHSSMRALIEVHFIMRLGLRKAVALSSHLGRLYDLRLAADYRPTSVVELGVARAAQGHLDKIVRELVKTR